MRSQRVRDAAFWTAVALSALIVAAVVVLGLGALAVAG